MLRTAGITLLASVLLSGCAAIFSPQPQAVPVDSRPAGAEVFVDGESVGTTPITLMLDSNRDYEVMLSLGGEERVVLLKSEIDGLYVALDIVPGLGLGIAGLAIGQSCSGVGADFGCVGGALVGVVGMTLGVASAGVAIAVDATTGAWTYLSPGEILVMFD